MVDYLKMAKELITITPAAAKHLHSILDDHREKAIKVSIDSRGCAGHKYRYDLVNIADADALDIAVQGDWGVLLLDSKSSMYLIGSTLDMKIDGFNSSLVWENPWAVNSCGCGESFSLASDGCKK